MDVAFLECYLRILCEGFKESEILIECHFCFLFAVVLGTEVNLLHDNSHFLCCHLSCSAQIFSEEGHRFLQIMGDQVFFAFAPPAGASIHTVTIGAAKKQNLT